MPEPIALLVCYPLLTFVGLEMLVCFDITKL